MDADTPPVTGNAAPVLRRVLGLPLLVFYGMGVTIGAGIFALIGEILGIAGDLTPLVFLVAAVLAGASAGSYAFLSGRFPKAAGAAVYAKAGFGPGLARVTGIGVALTGVISAAVISLAFGSYLGTLVPVPSWLLAIGLLVLLSVVASLGVRESIILAAVVTVVEVGTLLVVIGAGLPELADAELWGRIATFPTTAGLGVVLAATTVAFYAFIGFEDIVNMAEETRRPERVMAWAVIITLTLTTVVYLAVASIAVAVGDRAPIATSDAPMADLFAELTGGSPAPIAAIAAVAMINGVLIQIVMASRVLYGMAREGLLRPSWLGTIHPRRRTPIYATLAVAGTIAVLLLVLPIVRLAEVTSYVTLGVFTVVNLSLWRLSRRSAERGSRFRAAWGLGAAALSIGILVADIVRRTGAIG
ncbi:MAG: amino acid permease [Bauldia sp.]|nr:amino acid permease [Bauldia sp.]MCW5717634.1 amino acid permease [Bauldia sp.]MCW5929970.1 amino acid permease [Chitinophagaceae bacterium]